MSSYDGVMSSLIDVVPRRSIPEPVRITNWPLRDDGVRAWLMVGGLVLVSALAAAVADRMLVGCVTLAALALSVWRLWFPVTFDFSSRGVVQTCWKRQRRITWSQIPRYEVLSRGVLLSADEEPTPLAPLRSIYVGWHGQRDELLHLLEFFVGGRLPAEQTSAGPEAAITPTHDKLQPH